MPIGTSDGEYFETEWDYHMTKFQQAQNDIMNSDIKQMRDLEKLPGGLTREENYMYGSEEIRARYLESILDPTNVPEIYNDRSYSVDEIQRLSKQPPLFDDSPTVGQRNREYRATGGAGTAQDLKLREKWMEEQQRQVDRKNTENEPPVAEGGDPTLRYERKASDVLAPFDPEKNTPKDIGLGGPSTELTITVESDGKYRIIPSLWWDDKGNPHKLSDKEAMKRADEYEKKTGKQFPVFKSKDEANDWAAKRSEGGGASFESLAR